MKRIDKENYYLDIAETVLERSTCLRRRYGAIVVKNDEIVSTGYNAIISAARRDTLGATLYLAGREAKNGELLHDATSCSMCRRLIINAGIDRVVIRNTDSGYSVVHVEDWIREDDSLPPKQD